MAKVYLDSGDAFTISNNNVQVYGSTGSESVTVGAGTTGAVFDGNVEGISLSGASSDYLYQQTGNIINVYSGTTLVYQAAVQDDANGTQLTFSNGTTTAAMGTGGAMTLGGTAVSSTAPGAVVPGDIPAVTNPTFSLSQSATSATENGTVTFTITASTAVSSATTLTYSAIGDTLNGAATAATPNTDFTPASGTITFATGESVKTVTITIPNDNTAEGLEGFKFLLLDSSFNTLASKTVSITDDPTVGQSYTLTTAADSFTGTAGKDSFVGTLTFASNAIASTATLSPGDALTGGSGVDTLSVTVTGSAVDDSGYTTTPTLIGVEKVLVANFETDANPDDNVTFDLSLADTALTTIGTSSSSVVGSDTNFTNVSQVVAVEMAGKGGLSVDHTAGAVSGGADALTVTANGVGTDASTLSTFTFDGIETLNVVSSTASNYLNVDGDAGLKTVNISGAKNIVVDVEEANVTTVDATSATGNVTVKAEGMTLANVTLVGGSGTDTLSFDANITVTASSNGLKTVSGFEKIALTTNDDTIALSADVTGLTTINIADEDTQTVTLNTGLTQALTVVMNGDDGGNSDDTVTNNANIALTVEADAEDIENTTILTGGTGIDILKITADDGTVELDQVTDFNTITILAGTLGSEDVTMNVNSADATIDSGETLVVDASALTNSSARLIFTGAGETNGFWSVTGGAGNDNITGGDAADTISGGAHNDTIDGGAGNDVISGGDGNDSITAGSGNDSLLGGDGNDTFALSTNLSSSDTIDGGSGTDTLQVASVSTTALGNVTNVENLAITGANSVTLSANLGFTSFDLSDASDQVLTLASGYTNTTAVTLEAGDKVANSANITLNVTAAAVADLTTGTTITGGTGTDTITTYADATGATLTSVTGVETLTILANKTTGSTATGTITAVDGNVASTKTLTVDATALTSNSARFVFDGAAETNGNFSITGGASNDSIVGGAGNDYINGGAHNDSITAGAGNDNILGGAGNDTLTFGNNQLAYTDTVDGGDGTDTLALDATTAIADLSFDNVSNVETLTLTTAVAAGGVTLGTYASQAGIATVNLLDVADNLVVATGVSTGVTFVVSDDNGAGDTVTGGTGNDTFVFEDDDLDANDSITGTSGTDIIRLDNNNNYGSDNNGNAVSVVIDKIASIDQIVINDLATDNSAGTVSITMANGTYDQSTLVVDGSALDAGETLTFNAIASTMTHTDETFAVTGGAGNDTITGGAGNDTVVAGDGDDFITGDDRADSMTGGAGNDTFAFASGDNTSTYIDEITDFEAGGDSIKFTLTCASGGKVDANDKGDASSNADGLSLLSGTASVAQVGQFFFNTGNKSLVMDVDGNGLIQANDMYITLTGETGLSDADVRIFATGTDGGTASITGGGGRDVLVGADAADTLTGGAGNDYLKADTTGNNDVDSIVGGTGDDTIVFSDDGENDVIIEAASGGTADTLYINGSLAATTINMNAAGAGTDLMGASGLGIEQILIKTGENATFLGAQLTGNALTIVEDGTGTTTLTVTATVSGTTDLSNIVFVATGVTYTNSSGNATSATAMTSGTDVIAINGGDGTAEIIVGTSYIDSIDGGTGADVMTGGLGNDVFIINIAGPDAGGTWATADTITDFTSAADQINVSTAVGGGANYLEADGVAMANEAAVLAAARAALDGAVIYYAAYNVNGTGDGYLYYDADGADGSELVIKLTGVGTSGEIAATDIV